MVDVHTHILPWIDDGPEDLDAAEALARAFLEAGTTRVAATPHVNPRHRNDAGTIGHARRLLDERLEESGVELRIDGGAEISTSVLPELGDEELATLSLGGGSWLLIEPSGSSTAFTLHGAVFDLQRRGWKVLLAHPERVAAFQDDLELLARLVDGGARCQVTAESLTGGFGSAARSTASAMAERGLVHVVAADAHHATLRGPDLRGHLERAGLGHLADWLCREVPAAILDDRPLPDRPAPPEEPEPRGLLGRLGLRR